MEDPAVTQAKALWQQKQGAAAMNLLAGRIKELNEVQPAAPRRGRFRWILPFLIGLLFAAPLSGGFYAMSKSDDKDNSPQAQTDAVACEADDVHDWLYQRQLWINATGDVIQSDLGLIPSWNEMFIHIQAIEALERPECLDDAMIMTYYGYITIGFGLACLASDESGCTETLKQRSDYQQDTIDQLLESFEFDASQYADQRPEGWSLPTEEPELNEAEATAVVEPTAAPELVEDEATAIVEPTAVPATPTIEPDGSRTNPVPLNTFYQFDDGQVRIAGVVDPYTPTDQYSTVEAGMRIVALDIEYQCQTEDPNESCSWMDVMAGALVSETGTVNDDISWFASEPNSFTEQEAYSGNTLRGYLFLQVPVDEVVNSIRMNISFNYVFFLAQ